MSTSDQRLGFLQRLAEGPVICAEGYLFELERRGYLQAGAFVPEVVFEHPEEVTRLHRHSVHAQIVLTYPSEAYETVRPWRRGLCRGLETLA